MSCFVIAEAGVNHSGDEGTALALIDAAKSAGADAVKFQTFVAERLAIPGAPKAEYQKRQTGDGDQFSMLKSLELPRESYRRLMEHCRSVGIEFMSTPFDEESADFLVGLGMCRIKLPSGELTNLPYLEHITAFDLPIILSTGMGTLTEVAEAVDTISHKREEKGLRAPLARCLTLLHCTSNYPTSPNNVNLRAMSTMSLQFGIPVGYSDHTAGTTIAVAAAAMGAAVIEKHFTLDRNMPGPDHQASLEPSDLARMIDDIREVEVAMGDGEKSPRQSEIPVRDLVRKSVTLVHAVTEGHTLSREDLALLRPGTGIAPKELTDVVGRRVRISLPAGTLIEWRHLE